MHGFLKTLFSKSLTFLKKPKPYQVSDLWELRQKSCSKKKFLEAGSKVGSSGGNLVLYGSYSHVTITPVEG